MTAVKVIGEEDAWEIVPIRSGKPVEYVFSLLIDWGMAQTFVSRDTPGLVVLYSMRKLVAHGL